MVKMLTRQSFDVRPRKSTNLTSDEIVRQKAVPVFTLGENDFSIGMPRSNYNTGEPSLSKMIKPRPINPKKGITMDVRKTVVHQLEKYCETTTLHGLRYVGDTKLTFGERIFWLVSFSLAIGFAAYYISNIYDKWKSSPVIISFSPFDAELSSIPFPAVTICNMNQAKKSQAEIILKEGTNVDKKLLDDACSGNASFDTTENINWETLQTFLIKVGNSCSDILKYCQWGSKEVDCLDVFNNDLTDEGLCCSFNRLPPEKIFRSLKNTNNLHQTYPTNVYDWNAEKGFEDMEYGDYIPRRPLGAGAHLGLTVILDAQVNNYYCSSTRSTGFKVILSNPIETPKMADFGFLISPGLETRVTIEPSIRQATDSLRSVPIAKRQCYFSNERPLQYYRKYTMQNCMFECLSKISSQRCGCVPYFLPRDDNIKMCEITDRCSTMEKDFLDRQMHQIEEGAYRKPQFNARTCNCLHACFEVTYDSSKSSAKLFPRASHDKLSKFFSEEYREKNFVKMDVFFPSKRIKKTEKRVLYNFTDLIALTGGLFGFFTGFSFLSAIEVFFYLMWMSYKNHLKNQKEEQIRQNAY